MEDTTQSDYVEILRLIQSWGFWRDNGEWDALLGAYTDNGQMAVSWGQLGAADFVAACRNGMNQTRYAVLHAFGASHVSIHHERALVQTRMTLMLRGSLHGSLVDVTCYGRTYDQFVKTLSGWKIQLRSNIYEKSRIDPVDTSTVLAIDQDKLQTYPEAYQHLAYFQVANGASVPLDLPRPDSPELARLTTAAKAWLDEPATHDQRP